MVDDQAVAGQWWSPEQDDADVDPAVALKQELRSKPGDWYVIHSYAGYENKVKANLDPRAEPRRRRLHLPGEVPPKRSPRSRNGQRKQVNRSKPGYILVRMDPDRRPLVGRAQHPGVNGSCRRYLRAHVAVAGRCGESSAAAGRGEEGGQDHGCGRRGR